MGQYKVTEPQVNLDRNIVPLEDLTIFVDLVAKIPGRSIINNDPILGDDGLVGEKISTKDDIHFTFPNTPEGKKPSLTTSWTNIGGKTEEKTTEGFGITNVDIQFDASFIPRVTIDFVDIRGAALFEGGTQSEYYAAFFRLPYPLYLLQFKGYYGDAVTYPLHLMKFNSRFNGETGNFEIKCEFIGHTFAFLSDLLIGYALAAPYMKVGTPQGSENLQCNCDGKKNIETIKDYIQKVKKVTNDVTALQASKVFENYESVTEFKPDINSLNKFINKIKDKYDNESPEKVDIFIQTNFIKDGSEDNIKTYNQFIDEIITAHNSAPFNQINERLRKIKIVKVSTKFLSDGKNIQNDKGVILFDYLYDTIDTVYDITQDQIRQLSNQLKEESEEIKKENDFNATIKHAVDVLSCGFEIFLNRLKNTSEVAEKRYGDPADKITKKLEEPAYAYPDRRPKTQSTDKTPTIYPWPLYYEEKGIVKDENGKKIPQKILTYPGENPVLADMEEVKFVQNFIDAIFETKGDLNASESLITEGDGWMPCNIIESPLWDDEINNPYNGLKQNEILTRFISRVLVNISYSYALGYTGEKDLDSFQFQPDIVGANIADESDFFRWDDGGWESISQDIGYLKLLAQAEASNFFVAGVSDDIIKQIIGKDGQGFLDDIITKDVKTLNTNGTTETKLFKKQGGFSFSGVKSSGSSVNIYYCAASQNDGTKYNYTTNTKVRLEINDDLFVDGDSSGDNFSNFKVISKSEFEDTVAPKTNTALEDALGGAYGGSMFGEGFCKVDFSTYNVLFFRNEDNIPNTFIYSPYMSIGQRTYNRAQQGFDQDAWFINSKNEYLEQYINVCLESSDYETDGIDEPSKYFANKNKDVELYYGDFPFYIGDVYVGQIQDTYFYKLNKSNTAKYTHPITSLSYDIGNLSTGYLWLNSLELFKSVESLKKSALYSFANANGIVELPKMWVLYVGALLWRYEQTTEPILFGDETLLNGKINTSQVTQSEKIPLGAHWDLLNNTSFYNDNISKYIDEGMVISATTNQTLISIQPYYKKSFPAFMLVTKYSTNTHYINLNNDEFYNTLQKTPESVKGVFRDIFIEWATTSNPSTEFIDMSWSNVRSEIEDNQIRIHYSWLDNEYGIPRKTRINKERIHQGNLTNMEDGSLKKYKEVGEITEYPNAGTFTDDKALFYSGYYQFTSSNGDSATSIKPNDITQSGYLNTGSLVTTGNIPIYSPKLRFISQTLIDMLNVRDDVLYILNGTWRSFIPRDAFKEEQNRSTIGNAVAADRFNSFYATETTLVIYLDAFIERLKKIRNANKNKNKRKVETILDDPDLKLSLYLEFRNLYDKWIASKLLQRIGSDDICISGLFSYVDRAMNDIGDLAVINPKSIAGLYGNSQTSFYNIVYEVLSQNNFDFFPLPHFNGFGAVGDKGENKVTSMFEPTNIIGPTVFRPSFHCVYVGSRANTVDIEGSEYGNDVVDFDDDTKISQDFTTNKTNIFRVTFGLENQNIFKSISLDQSDFKETSESLQVIDDLTKNSNEVNNISFKGNDLFQVYSKRSYNCQVEMMGCAVVEPLMYFQLSNVPMFRGAYMIHEVSHNITANHMTTSFTGVRIPFTNLPYVSDFAVALGLIDDVQVNEDSNVKTVLDEEGNPRYLGDTKKQGTDTRVSDNWEPDWLTPDDNGEYEIVNRT